MSSSYRRNQTLLISDFGISRQLNTGATTVAATGLSKAALTIADNSYGSAPWSAPETFTLRNSKVCNVCTSVVLVLLDLPCV